MEFIKKEMGKLMIGKRFKNFPGNDIEMNCGALKTFNRAGLLECIET